MISSRSPLRISLGGGGTDLPSYYRDHEGFLIAAAIDKYVYVSLMKPFTKGIYLKYSELEKSNSIKKIKHPIIREAFNLFDKSINQIEVTTLADIPSGTGLGSSGSFTTALLKAIYTHNRKIINQEELAKLACKIEIDILKEPIGKQDQYIAAYGGINSFTFHKDETVTVEPLNITEKTLNELEDNLLLFYTGISRSAGSILKDQKEKSEKQDPKMIDNLHLTKEIGYQSKKSLEQGDLFSLGKQMHEHWKGKSKRSKGMSNDQINSWYEQGINNGAIGGKIVGAGGGGFLMFLAEDRNRLINKMTDLGLRQVRFNFDFEGTKNIIS